MDGDMYIMHGIIYIYHILMQMLSCLIKQAHNNETIRE